jgi:hypothetical protein
VALPVSAMALLEAAKSLQLVFSIFENFVTPKKIPKSPPAIQCPSASR